MPRMLSARMRGGQYGVAVTTDRSGQRDFGLRPAAAWQGRNGPVFPGYLTVAAASAAPSVGAMTLPDPEAVQPGRPGADRLISVGDIRALFKLGRTAAYELTHRPGFPAPVRVSSRCL